MDADAIMVNRSLIDDTRALRALPDWLAAAKARLQGQCAPALGIHEACEHGVMSVGGEYDQPTSLTWDDMAELLFDAISDDGERGWTA